MNTEKRIILDVDTGIDDALAILFAVKSRKLKVEGITTGYGNCDVQQVTENTLRVLELAQPRYYIPVAMGADKPLFRKQREFSAVIHGHNGLGGYELPETNRTALEKKAVDFIIDCINKNPGQITLVFTGRLTNLAIALAKDPTLASKVDRLILMGGALHVPGNITPVSEANIHGDPEAAYRVFHSGIPITMVGLDVTGRTKFGENHFEKVMNALSSEQNELKAFLNHIFTFSFEASDSLNEGKYRLMHDPLAVAVAEDQDLVKCKNYYIQIETKGVLSSGATLTDLRHTQTQTNASVCMSVKDELFLQHYINTIVS